MRASKKAVRAMDGLAAMLAQYGTTADVIEEIKETAPTDRNAISRQGEAVLLFLESPAKFTSKQCKWCEEYFGTNYRSVAYCSDNCRSRALNDIFGMKFNWVDKSEEQRWGGEPPLIIPPKAFALLEKYVRWFNDHAERFSLEPINLVLPNLQTQGFDTQVPARTQYPTVHTTPRQEPVELFPDDMLEEEDPFDF